MKIKRFLTFCALAALISSCTSVPAHQQAKHVVFIGMDGWGAYCMEKADMPNVKSMMENGSYTLQKRSVLPSSSAANWASMYMGAGPELHGYTTWGSQTPDLPPRVLGEDGMFPNVFALLREKNPEAEIGNLYEWGGMRYVCDTTAMSLDYHSTGVSGVNLTEQAIKYIKEKKPLFVNIVFDQPDGVGHAVGHDTPEYYAKVHELDGYVGEIVQAVKDAGIYDETIFVLSSDHGGTNMGHGGKTMQEMESPFIICGKGIKKGHVIENSMMQFDIAPTLAEIFDLEVPQVWIGRPMMEVFE